MTQINSSTTKEKQELNSNTRKERENAKKKKHKHGKVCQSKTLATFLENIHKIYVNILNSLHNILKTHVLICI